jgi:hypothetical protein
LNSKRSNLDNELGYLREGSSRSPNSPGLGDKSRRKNDSDYRSKNSDVNRRARIGEREIRNVGRNGDSSDDSDLSDGYSRARMNDRIAAEERSADNKEKLLVPKERSNRAEHSEASQTGRIDNEDDEDVPASAGTALANLFDRIARGKSNSIRVTICIDNIKILSYYHQ